MARTFSSNETDGLDRWARLEIKPLIDERLFVVRLVFRLPGRSLFSMAHIQDPDDLLSRLNAEDDSMGFEEKLAKCSLEIIILSSKGAALGRRLQSIDLPIKAAEPFCGVFR